MFESRTAFLFGNTIESSSLMNSQHYSV